MKRMPIKILTMRNLLLPIFLFSFSLAAKAQVDVQMRLDRADILIGEQIRMEVSVKAPKSQTVIFPDFPNGYLTDSIEVLERGKIDTLLENDLANYRRIYTLTAFDSALYYLPQVTVEVDGKEYRSANDIGLKVSTVPVDTLTLDDPRPLKGPVSAKFEWNWWLWLAGLSILLLTLLCLFLSRKLTHLKPLKRRVVILPPTPPHKLAMSEMDKIRPADDDSEEAQKSYYVKLTDILRTYIEGRFGIDAREMTSDEITEHLLAVCETEAYEEMRSLFQTADLVKFAKYRVSLDEDGQNLLKAVDFVRQTKMENPEAERPIIQEMPLSDRKQLNFKRFLQFLLVLGVLSALSLAVWLSYEIYICFL